MTVEEEGKTLVAQWGGISLKRDMKAELDDKPPRTWITRTELVQRLLADTCELCGSQEHVQVHHVRALRDLQKPGRSPKPYWVRLMAARRRKTLVLCQPCHTNVHHGRPEHGLDTGEPDAVKVARPVRTGVDGKVLHTE